MYALAAKLVIASRLGKQVDVLRSPGNVNRVIDTGRVRRSRV